jgi:hypothetical protein
MSDHGEGKICPECGKIHSAGMEPDILGMKITKAITDHFISDTPLTDGRRIVNLQEGELLASLARVVGFFVAASPDSARFLHAFGEQMFDAAAGFADPDHPNHPAKVLDHVFTVNSEHRH